MDESTDNLEQQVRSLLEHGKKLEAVHLYKEETGASLADAKQAVEAMATRHGLVSQQRGCLGLLAAMMVLVVGVAVALTA
jgi:hypothetical protein